MNINKKTIEGLKAISAGLTIFIEGLEAALNETAPVATAEETPAKSTRKKKPEPEPEVEPTEDEEDSETAETIESAEYTEEELNNMSYNDIKKLAKELGISAVGNRKEIVKKILSMGEEPEDEAEEETPAPTPKKSAKKSKIAVEEEEPEEEPEEVEDESEDDEDEDSIAAQVNEIVEDMDDDEIRSTLESVGISSKGKRQALISKLISAVEEGLISLEDEDEPESEEEPEEESAEESESEDVTKGMTKKRKKAYDEVCKETEEAFEDGDITREDLVEFLNEYNGTKGSMKNKSDEDLLTEYLRATAYFVSDDGETVEEGCYYINGEPYCCGHALTYDKKNKTYKCSVCGEEYEAE